MTNIRSFYFGFAQYEYPVRDEMLVEKCNHTFSESPVGTQYTVRHCVPNSTLRFLRASIFYQHCVPYGTLTSSFLNVFLKNKSPIFTIHPYNFLNQI